MDYKKSKGGFPDVKAKTGTYYIKTKGREKNTL